jgi:hypothetical protein
MNTRLSNYTPLRLLGSILLVLFSIATGFSQTPQEWEPDPMTTPSFTQATGTATYFVGSNAAALAVGDWSGDGLIDVAIGYSNGVQLMINNGDGSLRYSTSLLLYGTATGLAVADLNRDGRIDIAVVSGNNLRLFFNQGNMNFVSRDYSIGLDARAVAVADLNQDGSDDVVVSYSRNVKTLLNDGRGNLRVAGDSPVNGDARSLSLADFNRDGRIDAASASGRVVTILYGNGNGTLRAGASYSTALDARSVKIADFNRDGLKDYAVVAGNGLRVSLQNTSGTFREAAAYSLNSQQGNTLQAADLSGDGAVDVVAAGGFQAFVFRNTGTGSLTNTQILPLAYDVRAVINADLNRDGRQDLLFANSYYLTVVFGRGGGVF